MYTEKGEVREREDMGAIKGQHNFNSIGFASFGELNIGEVFLWVGV